MFEIYTIVPEIHNNIYLDLGVKNFIEYKAELNMRYLKFKFLNRSIPVFSLNKEIIKPQERSFLKFEAPFLDEISGSGKSNCKDLIYMILDYESKI